MQSQERRDAKYRQYDTAENFNLLSFIPLEETADPRYPPAMRAEIMEDNVKKR